MHTAIGTHFRGPQMPAVLFDKFGGKHGGFSIVEQAQIRQAVQDAFEFSSLAYQSAGTGFLNRRALVAEWFGASGPATMKAVAAGVTKMHLALSDSSRLFRFVDARNQSEKLYGSATTAAPGPAGRPSHGAVVTVKSAPTVVPMGAGDYAYVKCLADQNSDSKAVAHAGSGMRIYLGERGFHPSKGLKDRSMTVYHELTHKVLGTVDYNAARQLVYGVAGCRALARSDPAQALKHADCWCYFAASFKYQL